MPVSRRCLLTVRRSRGSAAASDLQLVFLAGLPAADVEHQEEVRRPARDRNLPLRAARLDRAWQGVLCAQERPAQVDGVGTLPGLERDVGAAAVQAV